MVWEAGQRIGTTDRLKLLEYYMHIILKKKFLDGGKGMIFWYLVRRVYRGKKD